MVRRRQRQRSLWEVVLPEVATLWPASLRRIDALLEDEAVREPVAQALEARWPQSRRRGRPGTPAEVVLRMLVLKHLYRWSYDELEREVRANLVYRGFARIGDARGPDAKTILKIAQTLGPEVIQALHRRVVALAIGAGGCGSIRPSWRPPSITRPTARCCGIACGCSRGRCSGWAPSWAARRPGSAIGCAASAGTVWRSPRRRGARVTGRCAWRGIAG